MTSLSRKAYHLNYYQQNKEKLLAQAKIYYQLNTNKKLIYNKQYRDTHALELYEKKKIYLIKTKEERDAKNKTITCECGSIIKTETLKKHLKTKKHKSSVSHT